MTNPEEIARHYNSGYLLKHISDGCTMLDLTPPMVPDALAAVDEFHIADAWRRNRSWPPFRCQK